VNWIRLGVFIWGTVTIVLSALALGMVLLGAHFMTRDAKFAEDAPLFVVTTYTALKDNGSLIAGVLGFSALAWAYFFQANK
jgi:hypothetical protein